MLLPGGDVVVIWEYIGMARLDRDSHLKWSLRNGANHDLAVDREGRLYTLTREIRVLPDLNPDAPVFEDFVTVIGQTEGPSARSRCYARSRRSDSPRSSRS